MERPWKTYYKPQFIGPLQKYYAQKYDYQDDVVCCDQMDML